MQKPEPTADEIRFGLGHFLGSFAMFVPLPIIPIVCMILYGFSWTLLAAFAVLLPISAATLWLMEVIARSGMEEIRKAGG